MVEVPASLLGVGPGPPDSPVLVAVLCQGVDLARGVGDRPKGTHEDLVLLDVVGPLRRGAHVDVTIAEAGGLGGHRLGPLHRTPELADAALVVVPDRGLQVPERPGHARQQGLGLVARGHQHPDELLHDLG